MFTARQSLPCLLVVGAILLLLGAEPAKKPPKLTREQLEELFKGVKLPGGDPIPDFKDRPWKPTNPDTSTHNKRGTRFGPALSFTIQLDKTSFVRRGLTVQLPQDQAILYDLDMMSVAATWAGGFIDFTDTHFEDEKGKQAGRPGGIPSLWAVDTPGWADSKGSISDPRAGHQGPLPVENIEYLGHILHGYRTILSYKVQGRSVLEMPSAQEKGPRGLIARTFHVAAGKTPLLLTIAHGKEAQASQRELDGKRVALLQGKEGQVQAAVGNSLPEGSAWKTDQGSLLLSIPASKEPLNFTVLTFAGPSKDLGTLTKAASDAPPVADLRTWVRGGPPRWPEPVITVGKPGKDDDAYVVDRLTIPSDNPWKSWIRPSAHDFFSDGRLAMASLNGDIWILSGIDDTLGRLQWRRFATGLYEPLGLRIVKDQLYVLGRDRISRLHDLNADGESDYYETFFARDHVAPGYHAFAFDLQTDSRGYFYFVRSGRKVDDTPGHNALIRVSPDGRGYEIIARGFRHPNGMGVGPNDEILVSDNQGEFIPASKVSKIHKGGFYGYEPKGETYEGPLFFLPMKVDPSSGGQLWAGERWGPLSGKLLHTSYGTCELFYVLTQDNPEGSQATVIPMGLPFLSGIMRGRVNPVDGQVYLTGLKGWGTKAKQDGCLERVRYTGKPAALVEEVQMSPEGIRLTFCCPLSKAEAEDVKSYQIEQWGYIYSKKYGSPEMSIKDPTQKGHDPVPVKQAILEKGGRSVLLRVSGLQPVDQLQLSFTLKTESGKEFHQDLYSTIHRIGR